MLVIYCGFSLADTTANGVYGQGGSFTSNTANNGGLGSSSLAIPSGMTLDSSGNSYVTDFSNNRVLFYLKGSTTASRVYGQGGSFTSNTANNGGISADSLAGPNDVALDSAGNVYISDFNNNRVLMYAGTSTTATAVYGQGGSFTTNTANNGGISATSLSKPNSLLLDASRNLYISDGNNNRVLFYLVGSTIATRVYGQSGSFTTSNSISITADSLAIPTGLALDSSNNLYISDGGNSRVLFYLTGSTTATRVYGQVSFTVGDSTNPGGVSASTLRLTRGIFIAASGDLYVCDGGNNRVLYYLSGQTVATKVYGQLDLLTTNTANIGGISARTLSTPVDVAVDTAGKAYITDALNNRVLTYDTTASGTTASGTTATTSSGGTTAPAGTSCFHVSTIIAYKGCPYSYQQLLNGDEKECRVPHTVKADGLRIELIQYPLDVNPLENQRITLRLTPDHLVSTSRGLIQAQHLEGDDLIHGELSTESNIKFSIIAVGPEKSKLYFGLNCLEGIVMANGARTSTFGSYHIIPSAWMSIVGRMIGVDQASRWGDHIATQFHQLGLL